MSNQYDDTNRGAIWVNKRKKTDTDPDFSGEGNLNGEDVWISAWRKGNNESREAPVLRMSFKKKGKKKQSSSDYYQSLGMTAGDDDAIY